MRIEHLSYIKTIVECQSISLAAEKLFISQQTLSNIINKIEKELQFPLFHRTNRGVCLTEKGETAITKIDLLLLLHEDLISIHEEENTALTALHLSTAHYVNAYFSRELVQIASTHFPKIQLQIIETPSPQMTLQQVLRYECDIGLCYATDELMNSLSTVQQLKNHTLTISPLMEDKLCILLSHNHPLSTQNTISVEHLYQYPLVFNTDSPIPRNLNDYFPNRNLEILMYSNNLSVHCDIIQHSQCLGTILESALTGDLLDQYQLTAIPFCDGNLKLFATMLKEKADHREIKTFLELFQQTLKAKLLLSR